MAHTISIRDGRDLADNEEPEVPVESLDIDVRPTLRQGSYSTIRHMDQISRRNAMTNHPRYQNRPREHGIDAGTAFAHGPCQIAHARATSCGRSTG